MLTFVPPGTPEDRIIQDYARLCDAHIHLMHRSSLSQRRGNILSDLRRLRSRFVTVFVPTEMLDANFAFEFQDLAASLDADLFTDFAYSFVPVANDALLQRWVKSLKIADHRLDRRFVSTA
ncbi:MAG: hypothetical protein HY716_14010 [Planctomycetes bacterium]|nr:hypothetical protein [Planctomycetota bacterium]